MNNRTIRYESIVNGYSLSNKLENKSNGYEDVSSEPKKYIFSKSLIRFRDKNGNTVHSATYLGTSKDGTIYTWSKNGDMNKPQIQTLNQLKKLYGAHIDGIFNRP